jgi:hypothetical protein
MFVVEFDRNTVVYSPLGSHVVPAGARYLADLSDDGDPRLRLVYAGGRVFGPRILVLYGEVFGRGYAVTDAAENWHPVGEATTRSSRDPGN